MRRKPDFPNLPPIAGVSEEDCLLRPRDAAQILGVHVRTLQHWRRSKHCGPSFVRVGGRPRYKLQALRQYVSVRTVVRAPGPTFYRLTRIEQLSEKHPGLRGFIEELLLRRVPHSEITAAVLEKWGERVSGQVLHNFYVLRIWPKESSQKREGQR